MIERNKQEMNQTKHKRYAGRAALYLMPWVLAGCAGNITGLVGAQEDFGCPASGGVNCTTVSSTYEREHASETESRKTTLTGPDSNVASAYQSQEPAEDARIAVTAQVTEVSVKQNARAVTRTELTSRAPERLVMLWILPWVDTAGDLHSDSRVWMRVRDAAWKIESVRTRAMQSAPETAP